MGTQISFRVLDTHEEYLKELENLEFFDAKTLNKKLNEILKHYIKYRPAIELELKKTKDEREEYKKKYEHLLNLCCIQQSTTAQIAIEIRENKKS